MQAAPVAEQAPQPPSGPLTRAASKATQTEGADRVVVQTPAGPVSGTIESYEQGTNGSWQARILGDDGQFYQFSDKDNVQIAPEGAAPDIAQAAPDVTEAAPDIEQQAASVDEPVQVEQQQEEQAPEFAIPEQPEAATEPVADQEPVNAPKREERTYDQMDEAELRDRLKYLADQAKSSGGWNKTLMQERRKVEAAISKVVSKPDEKKDAEWKKGMADAAPTFEEKAQFFDQMAVKDEKPAVEQAAPAQPATDQAPVKWFGTQEKAEAFIAKKKLADTHEVVPAGKSRFEIREKAAVNQQLTTEQPATDKESLTAGQPASAPQVGQSVVLGKGRTPGEVTEVGDGFVKVKMGTRTEKMELATFERRLAAAGEQPSDAESDQSPAATKMIKPEPMSVDSFNNLRKFTTAPIRSVGGWQIVDVSLPGMPSFTAMRKIREVNEAGGGFVVAEGAGSFPDYESAAAWAQSNPVKRAGAKSVERPAESDNKPVTTKKVGDGITAGSKRQPIVETADAYADRVRSIAREFSGTYSGRSMAPLAADIAEHAIANNRRLTDAEIAGLAEKHEIPADVVEQLVGQPFSFDGIKGAAERGEPGAIALRVQRAVTASQEKPDLSDLTEPSITRRANPGNLGDQSYVARAFIREGDVPVMGVGGTGAEALAELRKDADRKKAEAKPAATGAETVNQTISAEIEKQKRRVARYRNEIAKAETMDEKRALLTKQQAAETRLTKMRLNVFQAEDLAAEAIKTGSNSAWTTAGFDLLFTDATDAINSAIISSPAVPEAAAKPAEYGASNKLVTADRAAEVRAKLKAKLNGSQLNSGFDPEILALGAELAAFHIEAGARKFADFAQAMAQDLDMPLSKVRPYLRGWFNGARDMIEDAGLSIEGMDGPDEVRAALAKLDAEVAEQPQEPSNDTQATEANPGAEPAAAEPARVQADEGERAAGAVPGEPDGRVRAERGSRKAERAGQPGEQRQPGEGATAEQPVRGDRGNRAQPGDRADASNYRIQPGELKRTGSWKATAEQNVRIVELVKQITAEGRQATPEEKALLTKFTGWGASEIANGIFPDQYGRYKDGWRELGERLKAALTPEEYAQAKRTTQYAHYTSEPIIRSVYSALDRMGFNGGQVLEPGMGVGLFNGLMPDSMAASSSYTGIEYDSITGNIARLLYPESNIVVGDFTQTKLPKDFFDAAIGNPPFGQIKIQSDPEYKRQGFLLHDYFFAKTIDRVKPGGLLVFVTSKGTMDKASDRARKYLSERADLVGAIRLPQTAFKDNAGTEVVTDVIFLRKRQPGQEPAGEAWAGLAEVQTAQGPAYVNEYFAAHPEMVLGRHAKTGSMYRADEYTVEPIEGDIEQLFAKAIENLPEGIYRPERGSRAERAAVQRRDYDPKVKKEGGVYVAEDGTLMQVESGQGVPLTTRLGSNGKELDLKPREVEWLKGYTGVRDALKQAQYDQLNDGPWEKSLKALNKAYDAFTKEHGPILAHSVTERENADGSVTVTRRFKNEPLIRLDAEGALAYALEVVNTDGTLSKGAVLGGRTLNKPSEPTITSSQDAMFVSLNEIGRFDIAEIARLAGKTEAEVISDLGDAIYEDPSAGWTTADDYLSGNVVRKLKEAEAAARLNKTYARNVEALKNVQPRALAPQDITVQLGSAWVPASDVQNFAAEVMGDKLSVSYSPVTGQWNVDGQSSRISEWGTADKKPADILEAVLNNRQLKVTYKDADGKTHTDPEATEKVNDIAKKLRAEFKRWIWSDTKRADRLAKFYNENYNNIAPRQFDGSHLTLPGVSSRFQLRPHQKRAIWRTIQQGDTYYAHAVGAGKAQPLDSKLLTPRGWVRMGDVKVGDQVITKSGKPTMVEAVFPQGEKDIFRVIFSDGSSTECCAEHLWLTQTYAERNAASKARLLGKDWPSAQPKVRQLSEIMESLEALHLGAKNHSIPMVGAIEFEAREIPLDPYLVGALLGDGHIGEKAVSLSSVDREVIYGLAVPDGTLLRENRNGGRCPSWHFIGSEWRENPVLNACRDLGMAGKLAHEKAVPESYLFNTPAVRLAVLRGLLDTDGTISKAGRSISFTTVSARLADDVVFLVQSFGGTVGRRVKTPTYTHNGERREGRLAHEISICLPAEINPFHIERKASKVVPKTKYAPARYIVSVEPVGKKPAQCIRVADPSRLYVTDDFIVTHNTFTMIAAAMEERRLGLSNKPLFAVPNHMLAQFSKEFLELYPTANIMVADEQNFHTHNRRKFVAQAALNDPDAIVITHSAFGRIGMSPEFSQRFIENQIGEWQDALEEVDKQDRVTRKQIERRIEQLENRLKGIIDGGKKDQVLSFEELGVDRLYVDEGHEFRKLDFPTNRGNIKGIDSSGSQRAMDLFMKVEYLHQKNPTRALVMASGTPITNTMGELFTVQRFFQPGQLAEDGDSSFDAWANHYGEVVDGLEQNAAGMYETVSRFAKFVNVPELMSRVRSFMDILTSEQLGDLVQRPDVETGGRQVVVTPSPDGYKEYQKDLENRIKAIRNRKGPPKPGDDIILSVIADGRFSAIDMRFVDPTLPSDPNSKLNRVIDEMIEAYRATADNEYSTNGKVDPIKGGSLMLFTDIGLGEQSAASRGFNMKAWIEKRLIEGGVKPDHIAFMRDNKAHAKKERLFDDLRQGRKRILIGGKDMETGVNAQKRLVYLGHLDAPWFPASVEQREGRIIRQGNQNKVVTIKAYATKGSYDSTMWGMNARKARFIEQAMSGDTSIRSMEDVSEASAFEMAAALASGDERYLKLAGLKGDVDRLSRLYSAHLDDQRRLRSQKMGHESTIKHNVEQVEQIQAAIAKRKPIAAGEFSGTADGKAYDKRDEFSEALFAKFKDLAEAYTAGEQTIGEIGGFPIVYNGVELLGGYFGADATVDIPGNPDPLITFPIDPNASVAGIATRAANQVNGLDREVTKRQGYIAESKDAIEKIDRRLGAAFPEQSELQEKREALSELEAELEAESKAANADAAAATVEVESDIEQPINGDRFSVSSADRVRGFGSKEKLREFLADGPFGKFLVKRIDEGKIVLHDDTSTIPGANGMKSVGGVTNIDGKIHLNAATLGRNRALGVALHELFHAGAMPLIGTKAWDGLIARLGSLRKQAATGSPKLRALHDAANRRIETANTAQVAAGLKPLSERQRNEEFGAYLIEEYENLPQAYRSWVDEFLGQVKAWLLKTFGRQVGQVTPEQLRALAIMALRSDRAMGAEFEFDTSMQSVEGADTANADIRFSVLPDDTALEDAISALDKPEQFKPDFIGQLQQDIGRIARFVLHPRQIAALHKDFTPVYRTAVSQFEMRDSIIDELQQDHKSYDVLPQKSKQRVNAVLELGRLLSASYSEQQLRNGIVNPGEKSVVKFTDGGSTYRAKEKINALLTAEGEVVKLSDAEIEAYLGLRAMFDKALDKFKDQTLEDFGLPDLAGKKNVAKMIMDMINENTPAAKRERLEGIARFVQEIEQAKRTGYVPFARYGDYVVAVKEQQFPLTLIHDPDNGGWITRDLPLPYEKLMDEIGAQWDELEGGYRLDRVQRQALVKENERTIHSAKVEFTARDKLLIKAGRKVEDLPSVKKALAEAEKWKGDSPNRRIVAFDTVQKKPEGGLKLSDVDALAEVAMLDTETWDAVRDQLSDAIKGRSFRKHFFQADNVPGYTEDFERAIADYMAGMAGYLSRRHYNSAWDNSVSAIKAPRLFDYANKYRAYANEPQEELAMLRQVGFFLYIAGVPATAVVNLTQPFLMTIPALGQIASMPQVIREMGRAYKDALAMVRINKRVGLDFFDPTKAPADIRPDLMKAWADGMFVPLQTYEVMATARNRNVGGRRMARGFNKTIQATASLFSFAERLNRLVTFIASARLAQKPGVQAKARQVYGKNALARQTMLKDWSPASLADFMVDETQFRMGKANRAVISRGIGAVIMQFKGFVMQSLEAWFRLATLNGAAGVKAVALSIGAMMLIGGLWGMPGADDLRDMIEKAYKQVTKQDLDMKTELRRELYEATGQRWIAEVASKGATYPFGLDFSRVGMGNIAPDSPLQVFGIPADLFIGRPTRAFGKAAQGDAFGAVAEFLPNFLKNPLQAYGWTQAGVRDGSGRLIMDERDVGAEEVTMKSLGFQPSRITDIREYEYAQRRLETANDALKRDYLSKLAKAIAKAEKYPDQAAEAMAKHDELLNEIDEHNAKARGPEEMIIITRGSLKQRLARELGGVEETWGKERKQARGASQGLREVFGLSEEQE